MNFSLFFFSLFSFVFRSEKSRTPLLVQYWSFYLHMLPSVVSLTTGDNPTLRHFSSFTQWMCVRPDLRYVWKNSTHDQKTRPRLDNGFVHSSWFFFSFCFVEKMPVRRHRRFFPLRSDGQINAAAAAAPSTSTTTTWIRVPREKKRIKQCLPSFCVFVYLSLSVLFLSVFFLFHVCVRLRVYLSIYSLFKYLLHSSFSSRFFLFLLCVFIFWKKNQTNDHWKSNLFFLKAHCSLRYLKMTLKSFLFKPFEHSWR